MNRKRREKVMNKAFGIDKGRISSFSEKDRAEDRDKESREKKGRTRKIKVVLRKAKDITYAEKREFRSEREMLRWMKKNHDKWVLVFKEDSNEIELWRYDEYFIMGFSI